jgi:hypothetical protein
LPASINPQVEKDPNATDSTWFNDGPSGPTSTLTGTVLHGMRPHVSLVSAPNWANKLFPQHFTLVSTMSAQAWNPKPEPALTAATPLLNPATSTGLVRVVSLVPSPTGPLPQHFTPPPAVRAHVWLMPAVTAVTPESGSAHSLLPSSALHTASGTVEQGTGSGVNGSAQKSRLRMPSWLLMFLPQHSTRPAEVTAHV